MSFTVKVKNINKHSQGGVYNAEKFMNEANRLFKLIGLPFGNKKKQGKYYLKINDEQIAFSLDNPNALSFDGVIETKDEAFIQQITERVKILEKFEAQIIDEDFDGAQKATNENGKALQELNALLVSGEITLQTEENDKAITLRQSPRINVNISVNEKAKMTNCFVSKVENKKSAWVVTFDGYRNKKKCVAELTVIERNLADEMCTFMNEQQGLNIEVYYKKTINDKTCKKIKGKLLTYDKALTQKSLQIYL